jgi:hypothetical protein
VRENRCAASAACAEPPIGINRRSRFAGISKNFCAMLLPKASPALRQPLQVIAGTPDTLARI